VAETAASFGRLDILVCNAGTSIRKMPEAFTDADRHHVLDTNLTSAFVCSQAAYPVMKVGGGGKMISTGSMVSLFGAPYAAAYRASKGGLVQVTRAIAPNRVEERSAWHYMKRSEATGRVRRIRNDVAELFYTSGTTGEPKGVMHTSNTLFANVMPYCARFGLNESDTIVMSSPLAHQTGFLYGVMAPIYLGGKVVLQDIWTPTSSLPGA
jgi:long-subunit acyl-CoA synthetase (AMP-forming)